MLIVLEGIDGSGKSTLAKTLAATLDAKIIHATRETPNDWNWFNNILEASKTQNIIADRFFWGQFAYQKPSERNITEDQLHRLERKLRVLGGKLMFVDAEEKTIAARIAARDEELSLPYETLMDRYLYLIDTSYCPVLVYKSEDLEVYTYDNSI